MTSATYEPTSVLFTGGAGFIGSNVMVHLVKKFPDVKFICLDKLNYCGTVKNFEEVKDHPNFTFVKGDIGNMELVCCLLKAHDIDTVMHFAAETHVDNSFGQSLNFTKANVLGTHTLLEASQAHGKIRRFIHVSTDEVYGESQADDERNKEDATFAPTNPYAASKAAAEFVVQSYAKSFKMPTIITRGNNVYGPKQYPEKLIPKFINLLNRDQPCPLHGDGTNRRSFLFVQDVAEAFEAILTKGQIGKVYNVGSEYEVENREVLDHLINLFGYSANKEKYVRFVRDRTFNDFRYHIDTSSLAELGWKQKVEFADGLKITKDWYLSRPKYFGDVTAALRAHPVLDEGLAMDKGSH